ncbi:rhodanese-like domain-containing protein [Arthrobacter cavernae]|uniref:Rhodanese-like domain-containing protein n=1 Tax=Arthrobacter cavernae TaxID=2817681 RepID=A0A939HJ54_9MICC|nr:rhodanese-like domain-containing protein [Arthrobacter cavernae]MBO1268796.1 rhodanese-like domain-containing protein [Arthrobacter cavernae]
MRTTTEPTTPLAIEAETLKNRILEHDDLLVIDVRSSAEFEALHIRGSYHVPLPLLGEHAQDFADRFGPKVVLVCQSGIRAGQARELLGSCGLEGAAVLEGGVPAFAAAGGDVVRGRNAWALERQVRMAAGTLVLAGIAGGRFLSPKLRLVAGGIGAGLTFSAATNSCAMGAVLLKMPWNRRRPEPTARQALEQLPVAS